MTRIISSGIAAQTFSLRDFYISRFWRLFPSVIVTIFTCLVASLILFTPDVALQVCKSALASMLSVSNVHFFSMSGYFDSSANIKPLLHTWSLSLEEQFFFIWPPALLLFSRQLRAGYWRKFALCTAVMCASSFALTATRGDGRSEGFDFFLLPTRMFEFGAGAFLHILTQLWTLHSSSPGSLSAPDFLSVKWEAMLFGLFATAPPVEFAAFIGLVLIAASYFILQPASPVAMGLPVVIGTMMIISTPEAKTNKAVLGNPLARWFGKLAYSVYLVHWPIYVYFSYVAKAVRIEWLESPSFLLAASVFLGLMMNKAVETRFRLRKGARASIRSFSFILLMIASILALSLTGIATNGWSFRAKVQPQAAPVMFREVKAGYNHAVGGTSVMRVVGQSLDIKSIDNRFSLKDYSTIVIGNSFVTSLLPAFYKAHDSTQQPPFLFNYRGGCPFYPPKNESLLAKGEKYRCFEEISAIWENVKHMPPNSTVVLVLNWHAYDNRPGLEQASSLAEVVRNFGHRPVVFGAAAGIANIQEFNACMDLHFVLEYWGGVSAKMTNCSANTTPRYEFISAERSIQAGIAAGKANFFYKSSIEELCQTGDDGTRICPSSVDVGGTSKSFYERDGIHLSPYGAKAHSSLVSSVFK